MKIRMRNTIILLLIGIRWQIYTSSNGGADGSTSSNGGADGIDLYFSSNFSDENERTGGLKLDSS